MGAYVFEFDPLFPGMRAKEHGSAFDLVDVVKRWRYWHLENGRKGAVGRVTGKVVLDDLRSGGVPCEKYMVDRLEDVPTGKHRMAYKKKRGGGMAFSGYEEITEKVVVGRDPRYRFPANEIYLYEVRSGMATPPPDFENFRTSQVAESEALVTELKSRVAELEGELERMREKSVKSVGVRERTGLYQIINVLLLAAGFHQHIGKPHKLAGILAETAANHGVECIGEETIAKRINDLKNYI